PPLLPSWPSTSISHLPLFSLSLSFAGSHGRRAFMPRARRRPVTQREGDGERRSRPTWEMLPLTRTCRIVTTGVGEDSDE
uniref:Uncharacterized protein n=1 Tax=Triticum urartu TaxID=4572 RepID=A0A8R7R286_TRIUA